MTTFELQEGEDLLRRCEHVVLKKLNGHLLLTNKRLIWTPPDGEKYLSIPLGVIKSAEYFTIAHKITLPITSTTQSMRLARQTRHTAYYVCIRR